MQEQPEFNNTVLCAIGFLIAALQARGTPTEKVLSSDELLRRAYLIIKEVMDSQQYR